MSHRRPDQQRTIQRPVPSPSEATAFTTYRERLRRAADESDGVRVLTELLGRICVEAGLRRELLRVDTDAELPGFYRLSSHWDVLVAYRGCLLVVRLARQGPAPLDEESDALVTHTLGGAVDLRQAYRAGRLGVVAPWLGFLLVSGDAEDTDPGTPRAVPPVDPAFADTTPRERYAVLCRRLVDAKLYDAACLLAEEPGRDIGFSAFAAGVATWAARVGAIHG